MHRLGVTLPNHQSAHSNTVPPLWHRLLDYNPTINLLHAVARRHSKSVSCEHEGVSRIVMDVPTSAHTPLDAALDLWNAPRHTTRRVPQHIFLMLQTRSIWRNSRAASHLQCSATDKDCCYTRRHCSTNTGRPSRLPRICYTSTTTDRLALTVLAAAALRSARTCCLTVQCVK